MYRILFILSLLLTACQGPSGDAESRASTPDIAVRVPVHTISNDFLLTAQARQIENLDGIHTVVIRCYCLENEVLRDDQINGLMLDMSGEYGSLGYHGDQTVPEQMQARNLLFDRAVQGGVLTLRSREWLYLHHFSRITRLQVRLPHRYTLRIEPMSEEALYQRSPFNPQ